MATMLAEFIQTELPAQTVVDDGTTATILASFLSAFDTRALAAGGRVIGEVFDYAGAATPARCVLCDGSAISRSTYSALFAAIGTTWGAGNGSTTFNVPDFRGRFRAMADNGAGRLTASSMGVAATLGVVGGNEQLHQHNHGVNDSGHAHTYTQPVGAVFDNGTVANNVQQTVTTGTTGTSPTGITIQSTGAGNSLNVPPVGVVYTFIYAGV
jgi:microcystin-dependent protein